MIAESSSSPRTIWYLNPWDALPGEPGFERGWQLAQALAGNGWRVVWWQSNFSHAAKRFRVPARSSAMAEGVDVRLLPVRGYQNNVSWARLTTIRDYVWQFASRAGAEPAPTVILIAGPIPGIELPLLWLKAWHGCALVFEFRDLWPETMVRALPCCLHPAAWLMAQPLLGLRRWLLSACDGLIALNQTYLGLAMRESAGGRLRLATVAYPTPARSAALLARGAGVVTGKPADEIWVLCSGTLGASHDHPTLLAAAALLQSSHPELRFFITGDGPNRGAIETAIRERGLGNVRYRGVLESKDFADLLGAADIGVALYRRFSAVAFPTKLIDYFFAGLAVLTNVEGEGEVLVRSREAGQVVPTEDPVACAAALRNWAEDRRRLEKNRRMSAVLAGEFAPEIQLQRVVDVVEASACSAVEPAI